MLPRHVTLDTRTMPRELFNIVGPQVRRLRCERGFSQPGAGGEVQATRLGGVAGYDCEDRGAEAVGGG